MIVCGARSYLPFAVAYWIAFRDAVLQEFATKVLEFLLSHCFLSLLSLYTWLIAWINSRITNLILKNHQLIEAKSAMKWFNLHPRVLNLESVPQQSLFRRRPICFCKLRAVCISPIRKRYYAVPAFYNLKASTYLMWSFIIKGCPLVFTRSVLRASNEIDVLIRRFHRTVRSLHLFSFLLSPHSLLHPRPSQHSLYFNWKRARLRGFIQVCVLCTNEADQPSRCKECDIKDSLCEDSFLSSRPSEGCSRQVDESRSNGVIIYHLRFFIIFIIR